MKKKQVPGHTGLGARGEGEWEWEWEGAGLGGLRRHEGLKPQLGLLQFCYMPLGTTSRCSAEKESLRVLGQSPRFPKSTYHVILKNNRWESTEGRTSPGGV